MNTRPVALVTGASRGIGKGIALSLANAGYDVAVNYCSDTKSALQAKQEIAFFNVSCEIVRADISLADDRARLVEFAKDEFGRCDLLVNNAGVAPRERKDILAADEQSFDYVMNVNLKGSYFLTQLIANWMIDQRQSFPDRPYRIVNISSISAYTSSPGRGEYCVSKAGMAMMTTLYADRLSEYGIGVYEVRPGIIETDMTRAVKDKYDRRIAEGLTPIRRWGTPQDVGNAVAAIGEGKLDFSTGQVIDVDGGFHLRSL